MENNINYVQYLQNLLSENKIKFANIQEFEFGIRKQQQIEFQISRENLVNERECHLLKTNIKEPLTTTLIQRYSRQMLLKQIAYEGQSKLINSKVAIIGSGGIGCPLALYLAAAGIGTLGLFDSDVVDITNLHRQIGHRTDRIGMQKTQSLKRTIQLINPNIQINKNPFITVENADLLSNYDVVIDGSDNPKCRYIVNDFCMKIGKTLLSGACIGWQAQITCYGGTNLCYRCLWGNDQVSMGGCSTLGVIGMIPGFVGLILAVEALKLIINGQSSLQGKLLTFDGKRCEFKKMALRKKRHDCIGCGQDKLNMSTYNYSKYNTCSNSPPPQVEQATWERLIKEQCPKILDVRPSNLYNIVHFINSQSIPFEILSKMSKQEIYYKLQIDETVSIPVTCVRGITSKHAVKYLNSLGIPAYSLIGGIKSYRNQFDRSIPDL